MKVIYWRSKKIVGYVGHGDPVSESLARAWICECERKYPEFVYWMGDPKE